MGWSLLMEWMKKGFGGLEKSSEYKLRMGIWVCEWVQTKRLLLRNGVEKFKNSWHM